jgi:hypothetical protein
VTSSWSVFIQLQLHVVMTKCCNLYTRCKPRSVTVLHKKLPLVSVLSQTVQLTLSQPVSFIYILYYHLRLDFPIRLFLAGFSTKNFSTPLPSPISATIAANLLLDPITRITFGEKCQSCTLSLCNIPTRPSAPTRFSAPHSPSVPAPILSLTRMTNVSQHIQNRLRCSFVSFNLRIFSDSRREDQSYTIRWQQLHPEPEPNILLIFFVYTQFFDL